MFNDEYADGLFSNKEFNLVICGRYAVNMPCYCSFSFLLSVLYGQQVKQLNFRYLMINDNT